MSASHSTRRPLRWLVAALAAVLALTLAACDSQAPKEKPAGPSPTARNLTFSVWGTDSELKPYAQMVADYNKTTDAIDVELETSATHDESMKSVFDDSVPDLFMISRGDLTAVRDEELNTPLIELLDRRGVDFGDGFFREPLDAFSADNDLQCMPYAVSPTVIYYNTKLVNFDQMRNRGLPAPEVDEQEWDLEMFTAAAEFASRPRLGSKGFYVDPTLRGLAPFIYSGGGELFNDDDDPTSLAFSDDDTRDALIPTLELVRDPQLTLSSAQLARQSAEKWFEQGKLGMIAGDRSLTPDLRAVPGLDFDVMPMPRIDSSRTVGDFVGVCVAADSGMVPQAADFLKYAVSDEAYAGIAEAGYVVPTNLQVATSDEFLQPTQLPEHASVFNASVSDMVVPPLLADYTGLEAAVAPTLRTLLTTPVPDVEALTAQIDEESRSVLDPNYQPPSGSPTGPSTGTSTGAPSTPSVPKTTDSGN